MATAVKRLRFSALQCTCRSISRRRNQPLITPFRSFTTTISYRDEDQERPSRPSPPTTFAASLHPDDLVFYDSLSPQDRLEFERNARRLEEHMTSSRVESDLAGEVTNAAHTAADELYEPEYLEPKPKPGFLAMGELDESEQEEDPVWKNNDMTSLAHGELEQHRELRDYARIAAWEMPLLSRLSKPFEPPATDSPLRFRYTTYMGETHPASKKVVLEFCTHDLPDLAEPQRLKLVKLTGVRYNPETDIVKMSSEMFPTQAQNKRYLGDLVDTLMAEAKNDEDSFADVPLDFRHHKWKRKLVFPERWKMTEQRQAQLEADRAKRAEDERTRLESGKLVQGIKLIEAALRAAPVVDESQVLVEAQQGVKGKGKGKAKRPKRLV